MNRERDFHGNLHRVGFGYLVGNRLRDFYSFWGDFAVSLRSQFLQLVAGVVEFRVAVEVGDAEELVVVASPAVPPVACVRCCDAEGCEEDTLKYN